MAEEVQAPAEPDTPEVDETPVEDTSPYNPVVNYEQRYNNLRPEFDRTKQQLREYEERLAAYEAQPEQEPEYDDGEFVDYDDRIERLEALIAQQDQRWQQHQDTLAQEQQKEQEVSFINSEIGRLEKEQPDVGEFTDEEWETLGYLAERYRKEDGSPDVDRAYEQLFGKIVTPRREKYVSTKKAPKVQSGPPAAEIPDLDTPQKRAEYYEQRLKDLEEGSF